MKKLTKKQIEKILADHKAWLKNNSQGTRADLTGANLTRANLTGADLTEANLTWADLTGANLTGADLSGTNLTEANLTWADLTGADLTWADLTGANLTRADLTGADLTEANLTWADLDYSCLPLWCGGSRFKADRRIVRQLLAHICTLEITDLDDELKAAIVAILPEAKKSHRASDLHLLDD